jgi:hypothetical protein
MCDTSFSEAGKRLLAALLERMIDQFSILKLVTRRLDAAGLAYMLTGSIAAGFYAQPRMTRDIDLVVELERTDAERVAEAFSPEFNCGDQGYLDDWAANLTVTDLLREVRA